VRTPGPRSRLRIVAPLVIAGTLVFGAGVVTGFEPGRPQALPESAFQQVVIPPAPASSPDLRSVFDSVIETDPPAPRAQPSLPAAAPIVVPAAPKLTHAISGRASWYCRAGISPCTVNHADTAGFNAYAAAGPRLRRALGPNWRGAIIYVDGVRVKIIDWCQCYEGQANEKLLDLYYDVYARVGSPVRIRW
jgi:hypothetical protein